MRLFKRRASDPAPQLVSLAPINSEMEHGTRRSSTSDPTSATTSCYRDYADYQTVTAMPALVVDQQIKKGWLNSTDFSMVRILKLSSDRFKEYWRGASEWATNWSSWREAVLESDWVRVTVAAAAAKKVSTRTWNPPLIRIIRRITTTFLYLCNHTLSFKVL